MKLHQFMLGVFFILGFSPSFSATVLPVKAEQMVVCLQPSEAALTQAEFNKVYPHFAEYISDKKKNGIIKDGYFIGNIMAGAVFIVSGENADDARNKGNKVASDLMNVLKENKINKGQCSLGARML